MKHHWLPVLRRRPSSSLGVAALPAPRADRATSALIAVRSPRLSTVCLQRRESEAEILYGCQKFRQKTHLSKNTFFFLTLVGRRRYLAEGTEAGIPKPLLALHETSAFLTTLAQTDVSRKADNDKNNQNCLVLTQPNFAPIPKSNNSSSMWFQRKQFLRAIHDF